jgi:hypothetical protein
VGLAGVLVEILTWMIAFLERRIQRGVAMVELRLGSRNLQKRYRKDIGGLFG